MCFVIDDQQQHIIYIASNVFYSRPRTHSKMTTHMCHIIISITMFSPTHQKTRILIVYMRACQRAACAGVCGTRRVRERNPFAGGILTVCLERHTRKAHSTHLTKYYCLGLPQHSQFLAQLKIRGRAIVQEAHAKCIWFRVY